MIRLNDYNALREILDDKDNLEKIFKWKDGNLKEQTGYYIYYEKNPQMQDFVLGENQNESVDRSNRNNILLSLEKYFL